MKDLFDIEKKVIAVTGATGVLAGGNPCRVIRKITAEDKNKYRRL